MTTPLVTIPGDWARDHHDPAALVNITEAARRITGADVGAIAIPVGAGGFILEAVSGSSAETHEGVVVPRRRLTFEPEAWARRGLSWCVADHVLPGAAHALFAPVPGTRSPTVALVVANREVSRPFLEDEAVALAQLATHPSVVAMVSTCSANRLVWGVPTGGRAG